MGGAERVEDEQVSEACQFGGESGIVLFLSRLKAGVLQQQHVPGTSGGNRSLNFVPDHRGQLSHRKPAQFGETGGHRRQGEVRVAAVRPTQVAGHRDNCSRISQPADGGQAGADAKVVDNPSRIQRYVEIRAHQHTDAGDVHVVKCEVGGHCPRTLSRAHAAQVRGSCRLPANHK
jgi:hypothetical protein